MTNKPLFSIIIPVYNVEKYLHQCLESIFCQDFAEYEVICVNDGSTDGSFHILQEYELKYKNLIIVDVENGGTPAARNIGLKLAKGEYIWFIDSDDWIEPKSLRILSKSTVSKPDIICFNGKLKYEDSGIEAFDDGIVEQGVSGWEYYNKYALVGRKFHFVCVVLRIYRRDFIIQNKLYFEKGISHEDNLWIPIVLYHAQSVSTISELLYNYRIRQGSKMQTVNIKKLTDIIDVANKLSDFFIPINYINKRVVYREIAGEYFKGFSKQQVKIYGKHDEELKKKINWTSFKVVSVYPRHKRIYFLLSIHPGLFRFYEYLEGKMKNKFLKVTHK